mgnify:FL=1
MKKLFKVIAIVLVVGIVVGLSLSMVACKKPVEYKVNKIGVQAGTTGAIYVKGDEDWGFDGYSNIECLEYSNAGLAVQAMKTGKVDAVIVDAAPAAFLVQKVAGIKLIDIELTSEEYAFAVSKAKPKLLEDVNKFLNEKKSDIDAIKAKYFDGSAELKPVTSFDEDNTTKPLIVATNAAFAPFEYMDGDKYLGIDMEIAKLLADYLGKDLVIKNMDFNATIPSVETGKADMVMAGLTISETRKQVVDFANSYFNASQKVIVLKDNTLFDNCKTVEDVEAILKNAGK